jgi:acetyl-CoA acetyltransferase
MTRESMRGKVAVAGVGQSVYYKHGKSPDAEAVLALKAILAACEDAGIDPRDIDGFASYSDDRNQGLRLAGALGIRELRFSNMVWGGGGGGGSAAVANAAAAIHAGLADTVVVFRALAQGQFQRFGQATGAAQVPGPYGFLYGYGLLSPATHYAAKVIRFMHDHHVAQSALRAVALAAYHHAQQNPAAVMYGRPLDEKTYDESRWIVEPFHLYDCCQENDGAAAIILTSAERAKDLRPTPTYLLGSAQGAGYRTDAPAFNGPDFPSANFATLARRVYEMAGVGPKDVDVVQSYENFTGGVVMSLVEHGFVDVDAVNEFFTLANLRADGGALPLNTSGGNLAEAYIHGMSLFVEAVRQLRGESTNQVPGARISMVTSGPMASPVSNAIFGTKEALS